MQQEAKQDDHERETWNRFRQGDERALAELATLYYKPLYAHGRRYSRDEETVKDCVQDLFLELWDRRAFLNETDSVKFYLFKSLRRKLYKETAKPPIVTDGWAHVEADYSLFTNAPVEQAIVEGERVREYQQRIEIYLARLSPRQQEVIHLRYYEAFSNEEIADLMGISRQAVANLLYRALKELKEHWGSYTLTALIRFLSLLSDQSV